MLTPNSYCPWVGSKQDKTNKQKKGEEKLKQILLNFSFHIQILLNLSSSEHMVF